ncbi:hypothetical protein [Aneurinibacillus sp. REN35]|uniref:hypothetical protein n=1 Tax=Aneurinibacillus sp. REN35 TaxID=3237286 RepID=UPI0035289D9E
MMNLFETRRRMADFSTDDAIIHEEFGEGIIRCINNKAIEIDFLGDIKHFNFETVVQSDLIRHKENNEA